MKGELILVPTPLQDDLPLESVALKRLSEDALKDDVLIVVEEHKVARGRWISWGLDRKAIEKFILFNEHSVANEQNQLLLELKKGKRVYLLSDCGLPAFCDPGQELVELCHRQKIKVTSTPFPQSTILALALSGFPHKEFIFKGFPPLKSPQREEWIKNVLKNKETQIIMDTPYRLQGLLSDFAQNDAVGQSSRTWCLVCHLGGADEAIFYGPLSYLIESTKELKKPEFILLARSLKA
jgi:16S rRNA (cytidine1402-2'-O)-methyltransferase